MILFQELRIAEHQVGLQILVELFRLRSELDEPLLDPRRDARKERRIEFAHVGVAGGVANRIALKESPPHRPWPVVAILVCDLDHSADGVESREQGFRRRRGGDPRRGLQLLEGLCSLVDIATVAVVADGEGENSEHDEDGHRRVGAELKRRFLELEPPVDAGETGLAEHHFLQQPLDEVRFSPSGRRRDGVRRHPVAPADGADQPIDRRTFLGGAGEVHAAQQDRLIETSRSEDLGDELRERVAQRRHLLRKRKHSRPAANIAILLHPREHFRVQPRDQLVELRGEGLRRFAAERLVVREGHAPDLRPSFLRQVVEVLHEAGNQIALGHHHVHRQLDVQLLVDLVQPPARRLDVDFPPARALRHEVVRADRQDDAVQRPASPVLLEQGQEFRPAGGVGLGVGILGRVATGGVEKDGFVGEPPIAIARAADAAQRPFSHALLERKLQPRIEQGRRLPGARGADDDVPRQVIQAVTAAAPRLLERRDPGFESLAQLNGFRARSFFARRCLAHDRGDEPVASLHRAQPLPGLQRGPDDDDQNEEEDSSVDRFERAVVVERKQRPGVPDENGQQHEAEEGEKRAAPYKSKHGSSGTTAGSPTCQSPPI